MTDDTYPIIIEPNPPEQGGGFIATAPDLPGCMSDGETREEAATNITGAIAEWLGLARQQGWVIPPPTFTAR